MLNIHHLMRMARWARHPPSKSRVILGLVVLGLCFAVAGMEWAGLWPDWANIDGAPRRALRLAF